VPEDGWELLPRYFWVWSNHEAEAIDAWRRGVDDHEPVVGGNLSRHRWEGDADPARRAYESAILERVNGRVGALRVLVTLNGTESPDALAALVATIAAAPPDWWWWVRCHPLRQAARGPLAGELARLGVANVDVDVATDTPLPLLLDHVDVHVTAYSSTVLDARAFGVPSVLTHSAGAELFAREIAGDWASVAGPDLVAAIRARVRRPPVDSRTSPMSVVDLVSRQRIP
jgi:hypothetical protein